MQYDAYAMLFVLVLYPLPPYFSLVTRLFEALVHKPNIELEERVDISNPPRPLSYTLDAGDRKRTLANHNALMRVEEAYFTPIDRELGRCTSPRRDLEPDHAVSGQDYRSETERAGGDRGEKERVGLGVRNWSAS